jgi:polar amino acid transport system permease protein
VGFFLDPGVVWQSRSDLLSGLGVTFRLAATVFSLSVPLAIALAFLRYQGSRGVRVAATGFVVLVRGVPAVVSIVFVFFALPFAGITLEGFTAAVLTLTLVQTVYFAEVFRAALAATAPGPVEAARAAGLGTPAVFRHVVAPQALALALPPFISSCIQLMHNTTIASVVTLSDLVAQGLAVQTATGNPSALVAVAAMYLALLLPLVHLARRVERRIAPGRWRG